MKKFAVLAFCIVCLILGTYLVLDTKSSALSKLDTMIEKVQETEMEQQIVEDDGFRMHQCPSGEHGWYTLENPYLECTQAYLIFVEEQPISEVDAELYQGFSQQGRRRQDSVRRFLERMEETRILLERMEEAGQPRKYELISL
jgi:hypothetical protein